MVEWTYESRPVPYADAMARMEARVAEILDETAAEQCWFLEHPALYTAGTGAHAGDLLLPDALPVHHTGRGGQFTYHGPGQLITYVMLNLKARGQMDVRAYVQMLEQWIIDALAEFGVQGCIRPGRVGVWVQHQGQEQKIAAIGIRIRKWVTYHGFCINICPDLSHYEGIVPCGLREFGVTSLRALGISASQTAVIEALKRHAPVSIGKDA